MNETIAIINDPDVTLGHLQDRNITLVNAWEVEWKDLAPDFNYILLGGHMGAYETLEYPYLDVEKKWISKSVNENYKILGICLGAQLIADALDGKAYLSDNIEFGFKNLEFLDSNSIFDDFKNIEVFSWHRDTFNIPTMAKLIAKTSFPQIYSIKNTLGIQFHPEINEYLFEKWYVGEKTKKELKNFDVENEFKKIKSNHSQISNSVNSFFDKWISS